MEIGPDDCACEQVKRQHPGFIVQNRAVIFEAPKHYLYSTHVIDHPVSAASILTCFRAVTNGPVVLSGFIVRTVKYTVLAATSAHPEVN
jgi:cephalosporin-C deacetylase-like acetyl esterase